MANFNEGKFAARKVSNSPVDSKRKHSVRHCLGSQNKEEVNKLEDFLLKMRDFIEIQLVGKLPAEPSCSRDSNVKLREIKKQGYLFTPEDLKHYLCKETCSKDRDYFDTVSESQIFQFFVNNFYNS